MPTIHSLQSGIDTSSYFTGFLWYLDLILTGTYQLRFKGGFFVCCLRPLLTKARELLHRLIMFPLSHFLLVTMKMNETQRYDILLFFGVYALLSLFTKFCKQFIYLIKMSSHIKMIFCKL